MRIGITNLKGGVGKTTLSINLAVCLAHMEYKVCIVDTDTNQNSLQWYGARDTHLPEVTVVGATDPRALIKAVNNLHHSFDIVIIDGTPNLGEMNTMVMRASDLLLIPTRPGAHDYRSMNDFIKRLEHVQSLHEDMKAYFVINEYDGRFVLHRTVKESLVDFQVPVLEQELKSRTAYGEANFNGTGVYEQDDAKAKQEMIALTTQVLEVATQHQFINQQ